MSRTRKPTIDSESFASNVMRFIDDDERNNAVASLREYLSTYTGRCFETLAGRDPGRYSADDVVAVTMLGVDIPANVSLWLLGPEGQAETSKLLAAVPQAPIWAEHADVSSQSEAQALWKMLSRKRGIARTKTSKLMAVKRPHLIPVYDQHVARALGLGNANDWTCWQDALRTHPEIREIASSLARESGAEAMSVLRTLDVIVWMRVHGFLSASKGSLPYAAPPGWI